MESQHGKNPFPEKPKTGKQENVESNENNKGIHQPEGFGKLQQEGRFQNPNETNASERVQDKVENNEPGDLEREGAENNAHNQNEEDPLADNDPNHGDS